MSKWQDMYKAKLTSPEEAVGSIRDNDKIMCGSGSGTPAALLNALFDRADELNNVQFAGLIMLAPLFKILSVEKMRHIEFCNQYATPFDRPALDAGICTHSPFHFSEIPRTTFEFNNYKKIFAQVSPMDKNGFFSCGISGNFLDCLHYIDELVLEVNAKQPKVHGMNFYHVGDPRIQRIVEVDAPVMAIPPDPVTDTDRTIAEHVVKLIHDGDNLQLGIGAVPNAIGEALLEHGRRNLGCYTEMIPDAVMSLFEAGLLDNSRKQHFPFKFNAFFAAGSSRLYEWLDDNSSIYLAPISVNNDPTNIAKNDNVVSINATLEIDIYGQCCSESLGNKHYSATGGQVDFNRGALLSRGGRSIIAAHSTVMDKKKGGLVSRIVPQLKPGSPVTLTRSDVMYVATEYGCVCLKGKTLRQRAQELISICHPDFRADLRNYAKEIKYFILPEHDPA